MSSADYDGNASFYEQYARYLIDPKVREAHDPVLQVVSCFPLFRRVIDLGCGQGNEFLRYGRPEFYVGMDSNALSINGQDRMTITADYRDNLALISETVRRHRLNAAVSLFSIEVTAPAARNKDFYERLFRETPVQMILTSGIFYSDKLGEEKVGETGGLTSYQTFSDAEDRHSPVYHQTQIAVPCPSDMFGRTDIDVWCLLQRAGTETTATAEFTESFRRLGTGSVPRLRDGIRAEF
jgi:hypothetical protein